MEDIDPPREMPGADRDILNTLEQHALYWDGEVMYQSTRSAQYQTVLEELHSRQLTYRCGCSRARLASLGHCYDGYCRSYPCAEALPASIRIKVSELPDGEQLAAVMTFKDRIQGLVTADLATDNGDFVIHRKDGLFAYQLAVVVDDIAQGITDIVRGSDILEATPRQLFLTALLKAAPPRYAHVPVLFGADGQKLSKQNHAPALDATTPSANLCAALAQLGQKPARTLAAETPATVLAWAVANWSLDAIPRQAGLTG
jgi:glutamyl-Q tRNA(Asp) synthetase